jgi:hypothetical protein
VSEKEKELEEEEEEEDRNTIVCLPITRGYMLPRTGR